MWKSTRGRAVAVWSSGLCALVLVACTTAPEPVPGPLVIERTLPPGEKIIFEDDFSSYRPAWKQVRGKWALEAGEMRQQRDDPREENSLMYVDIVDVSDVEITASVRSGGGTSMVSGAGLVFRLKDDRNYYMFRLAGQRAVLGKMVNNEWTDLANPQAADFRVDGQLESTETLRVRVVGDRIQCWVGSDSVVNLTDPEFATGKVGLSTFKATAAFDFIKIVEL